MQIICVFDPIQPFILIRAQSVYDINEQFLMIMTKNARKRSKCQKSGKRMAILVPTEKPKMIN